MERIEAYILLDTHEYRVTIVNQTLTHITFELFGHPYTYPLHEVAILEIEP